MASAIAASLWGRSGLELVQLDEATPEAARGLGEAHPDAVVCELTTTPLDFVFALLEAHPGLPVVGVDLGSDRLLVLSSQRPLLLSTDDLVSVLAREDPASQPDRAGARREQRSAQRQRWTEEQAGAALHGLAPRGHSRNGEGD